MFDVSRIKWKRAIPSPVMFDVSRIKWKRAIPSPDETRSEKPCP
jgi:hypothetical protein